MLKKECGCHIHESDKYSYKDFVGNKNMYASVKEILKKMILQIAFPFYPFRYIQGTKKV